MNRITVRKSELIKKLEENREKHRIEYKDAVDGFKDLALAKIDEAFTDLKAMICSIETGKVFDIHSISIGLPAPEDHDAEYAQAIAMLNMEIKDEIELNDIEFSELVMNKWEWKHNWARTNAGYLQMSAMKKAR